MLPPKHEGQWRGELEVYDERQQPVGTNQVRIHYKPINLTRAEMRIETSGVVEGAYAYERTRDHNHHQYHGPDLFGNGIAYGRYLYSTLHHYGQAMRLETRDTLIDRDYTLVVNWNYFHSQKRRYTTHGVLRWAPGEEILGPQFI